MHTSALRLSLVVGLASALSACGRGGGGSSSGGGGTPTPPVSNASPGGIWQGIDPISRLPVYALAAEDGRFQLIVDDAAPVTQYWGTLVTSGNSLSSSNIQVAKGPTYLGTATITGGSLTARQSLTAPVSYTPAPGGRLSRRLFSSAKQLLPHRHDLCHRHAEMMFGSVIESDNDLWGTTPSPVIPRSFAPAHRSDGGLGRVGNIPVRPVQFKVLMRISDVAD
jgi:hypothetical protein